MKSIRLYWLGVWTLWAAVLVCTQAALAQSDIQTARPDRVTLAAYNAEWFTDVFDDPYTSDESQPPKARADMEQLARAIRRLNPDVIGLEEVENEGVMRAFVAELLPDMGYRYISVPLTNSDRGQNIALLSRLPIVTVTSHRFVDVLPAVTAEEAARTGQPEQEAKRMARDLVQVELQGPNHHTLTLFQVHLKSKHDGPNDPQSTKWRTAEAAFARQTISAYLHDHPGALVAMLGDFNDLLDSKPLHTLLDPGPDGKVTLLDSHRDLPMSKRLTYLHEPYRHQGPIDYLLASPALDALRVPGSAVVLDEEAILGGSDHAPITATFAMK